MSNDTKLLLEIEDPNIKIIENSATLSPYDHIIRLEALLDYRPKACYQCGSINTNQIIRYGWRNTTVELTSTYERPTRINLKRRYFHCKTCHSYFLAQTPLVAKNCSISNNTRKACLNKLQDIVSMTHIASELATSNNYVMRVLESAAADLQPDLTTLPEVLLLDEIKTTDGSLSFEYMDGESHLLIDLVCARTVHQVSNYFMRYTKAARDNVKVIVTDMNYTYPKLARTVFPNAVVLYDRFHIVQSLVRAFNKTRIQLMKQFSTSSKTYKQLKRYWKLLLKPLGNLDFKHFHHWSYFDHWLSETDVVDQLLAINPVLKSTYEVLQRLMSATRNRHWSDFKLALSQESTTSDLFQISLQNLIKNQSYVENALRYNYSNGPLEGTNNKIKNIKRNAYGYRNFRHFRLRVLFVLKFQNKKEVIVIDDNYFHIETTNNS